MVSIFYFGLLLIVISGKGLYELYKIGKEPLEINDSQLLLGYAPKEGLLDSDKPIIANMKRTPHLLICGLSNCGKTKMVEYAIKDKSVILINVFDDDFRRIKARRINGNEKILFFFHELLKDIYKREKPLYIVIDELLVLCMDTKATKAITDLLAVGRHYNIFIIGISQIGTKEVVKFKDLFNVRVCFRQVEESSYRAVLGYSPEVRELKQRQFLYYSEEVGMGRTYDVC